MELTINNITKQYGNVTVLDDVSYRFTPGIYGILGANGAGKTTLFRIICGLMRANCGNIQYDHKDIALQAEYYRSILGFLPQDFRYYPDFTGLNFMMYIASLKGLNGKIAKKRCLYILPLLLVQMIKTGVGNKILYLFPINNLNVQNILGILYSKDAFFFHSFFINIGFIFIFQLLIRVGMQLYCFIYIKHWKF